MLHSLEWEGGNEPDANLALCYIPWSGEGRNEPDANLFLCYIPWNGEGENEPDANLSLCYIPWSEREGISQMSISPCVIFLGVGGRE